MMDGGGGVLSLFMHSVHARGATKQVLLLGMSYSVFTFFFFFISRFPTVSFWKSSIQLRR